MSLLEDRQQYIQTQFDMCIDQTCLVVTVSAEESDLSESLRLILLNQPLQINVLDTALFKRSLVGQIY